jgi:hypothetical protein
MMYVELANVLRGAGLRVEEIAGWQERGHGELRNDVASIVDVSHHTAGSAYGRAPSLSTCLYGVPGVPGPLCNVLQTREEDGNDAFIVIAAGISYNAGTGGFAGVSGNVSTIGTECEHTGVDPFPDHRAVLRQRAAAAILGGLGQHDGSRSCQHFEWSDTGKPDIGSPRVDANAWRTAITGFMQGGGAPTPTPPNEGNSEMRLLLATSDGFWCKAKQFWVVGPGFTAVQVGQGQSLEQILGDWGWLGPVGKLPGEWVDRYIGISVTEYARGVKVDKFLAAQP